jgi:hypothetical protein
VDRGKPGCARRQEIIGERILLCIGPAGALRYATAQIPRPHEDLKNVQTSPTNTSVGGLSANFAGADNAQAPGKGRNLSAPHTDLIQPALWNDNEIPP